MEEFVHTSNEEETLELAARLSAKLIPGSVIALKGDLGAGKTRFAKGLARGLSIDENQVNSPTFTLLQEYSSPDGRTLYHFDFYRIESSAEALEIGAEEYFYGEGISVIEWPEKIADVLPDNIVRVTISVTGDQTRSIRIQIPEKQTAV